jgi:predicted HicB family RNase H-like nuclease
MQYKEYQARVVFNDENKIFYGEVLGLKDVVTFQSKSIKELEKEFRDSIDDYLEFCKQKGRSPEKPPSEEEEIC